MKNSLELINTAFQLRNNVFLSQQISICSSSRISASQTGQNLKTCAELLNMHGAK